MQGLENGGIIMKNQKRHSRKLLSILLVLCMALTIVPITAFAADESPALTKESTTLTKLVSPTPNRTIKLAMHRRQQRR